MVRSRLEVHMDILKVLARRGPLKLTHIVYGAFLGGKELKECLEFLVKQNLVEDRAVGKRVTYCITDRGITVLKNFRKLEAVMPVATCLET